MTAIWTATFNPEIAWVGTIMATAKVKKEEIVKGDSMVVSLLIQGADKLPVDLSGCVVEWLVLEASEEPLLLKSSEVTGEITIDPDQAAAGKGKCSWTVGPDETELLPSGTYRHVVRMTTVAGVEQTVLKGDLVLDPIWG